MATVSGAHRLRRRAVVEGFEYRSQWGNIRSCGGEVVDGGRAFSPDSSLVP